jgi:protein-tyrosine phosphatase
MYDIHCHLLPGIDDGAKDLAMSLEMARMAVDDGITHLACTPHIYPGLFNNDATVIKSAVTALGKALQSVDIQLELAVGADIQVVPELVANLRNGSFPTINGSQYFLFEPPHHVPLAHIDRIVSAALAAGYQPVVTHPERLDWIDDAYAKFQEIANMGGWMQITAGAIKGKFGKKPKYWAERMLDDGIVSVLATDAHNLSGRAPLLNEAVLEAEKRVGKEEARRLVYDRPRAAWENTPADQVIPPPALGNDKPNSRKRKKGFISRLFG